MAEVAGLVIGGAGLLALFDSCMSGFEYVESAAKYGKDYQKAALKISLQQLRLARWAKNVKFVEDASGSRYRVQVANASEVEQVRTLLGSIHGDFEDAETLANKHKLNSAASSGSDASGDAVAMEVITEKIKTMAVFRQKKSSVSQKARWALHDKKKVGRLVEDLNDNITSLVELFPGIKPQEQQLARREASELVQPSEVEEPDDQKKAAVAALLLDAADGIDDVFKEAVKHQAAKQGLGNSYGEIINKGNSKAVVGDFYAPGYHGPTKIEGHHSTYAKMTSQDNAHVQYGNVYGGKHVFDT